jgi:hypothetical protein
MKASNRRNILKKCQYLFKGADDIIQPGYITSRSLEFLSAKKVLNSYIISRQATTTCVGDDGVPVLVSPLIFGYFFLGAQTIKS